MSKVNVHWTQDITKVEIFILSFVRRCAWEARANTYLSTFMAEVVQTVDNRKCYYPKPRENVILFTYTKT